MSGFDVVPPRAASPARRWRDVARATLGLVRDYVTPVVLTSAVAVASIPAPGWVAWGALLVVAAALGAVSRSMGVTAATASALLYMTARGRHPFAATITDPWAIRLGFLLGVLGAAGAAATSWWVCDRQRAHRAALRAVPDERAG
jgi:hypothetical protein